MSPRETASELLARAVLEVDGGDGIPEPGRYRLAFLIKAADWASEEGIVRGVAGALAGENVLVLEAEAPRASDGFHYRAIVEVRAEDLDVPPGEKAFPAVAVLLAVAAAALILAGAYAITQVNWTRLSEGVAAGVQGAPAAVQALAQAAAPTAAEFAKIAAWVFGGLVALALIGALVYLWPRREKKSEAPERKEVADAA